MIQQRAKDLPIIKKKLNILLNVFSIKQQQRLYVFGILWAVTEPIREHCESDDDVKYVGRALSAGERIEAWGSQQI